MQKKYTNEILNLLRSIQNIDYITPDEIPQIDLYMDQVTTFMDEHLRSSKRFEEDKILTKTMINNYTKNNLLPPPVKKKYSSEHMLLLIYIYYLKNFLSISDIQNLLAPMTDSYFHTQSGRTMSDIYRDLFELEQQYGIKLRSNIDEVCRIAEDQFPDSDDYLKTFAMITMLSYDIYAKKQLIERLIDSMQPPVPTKAERKEAKELAKQKEKQAKKES